MTATTTRTTGTDTTGRNDRPDSELRLERRREQLQRSRERADDGQTAVRETEARLRALDVTRQEAQRRLQAAEQELVDLKKQLKRTAKERARLEEQRRKARKRSSALSGSVREAESRYDKAVLADLVRREKERDLAVHAAAPAAEGSGTAFTVVDKRETQRSGQIAAPDPEVVPADPAPAQVSGRTGTRAPRARAAATGGTAAPARRGRTPRQA